MGDGRTRRDVNKEIGALLTGATATSLAGCGERELEPDDENDNGTDQDEPLDVRMAEAQNANLSNVDPSSTEPKTYGLVFSPDTAKVGSDLEIELDNGVQSRVYDTTTDNIQVINDGIAILNVPEELLVHGETELTATLKTDDREGELGTELNTKTPAAFPIDRRVEGEQASNFETPWSFAQHDLDRKAARQAHLGYVNGEIVREPVRDGSLYDGTHGLGEEYDERIAEIEQMDPKTEMLDILEIAGDVTSDLEHDVPDTQTTGTTQSGEKIGHGAAQIVRDLHNVDLRTIVARDPRNSLDSIIQYNPGSEELIFQGTSGTTTSMERGLEAIEKESETQRSKSMIYGFVPGEVEGIDYDNKSKNAVSALTSPSRTTLTNASTIGINDYAIETISQEHLFGDRDIEEALDAMASVNRVEEMVNYDINGEPVYDSPPGDSLGDLEGAMYVGFVADEGDSLEDMTLFVTEDESVYREMTENPEPKSRQEIEEMAGLK